MHEITIDNPFIGPGVYATLRIGGRYEMSGDVKDTPTEALESLRVRMNFDHEARIGSLDRLRATLAR